MRQTGAYDRIFRAIDEALTYPIELQHAGIAGVVHATLVFSPDGRFLRRYSVVTTASPYLRVVVMRALRRALSEPLRSARGLRARSLFVFDLKREFRTDVGVLGDNLGFLRVGAPQPTKIGLAVVPSYLSGTAPVTMPAVSLDPAWIVDQFRRDTGVDPLEEYRNDPDWR